MRTLRYTLALGGMVGASLLAHLAGCANSAEDCKLLGIACDASGATTSGGGSGTAGGGGTGGSTPVECVPSDAAAPVDDICGVFVSNDGDDDAVGSKGAPLKTLAKAIEKAMSISRPVYACVQTFKEAVTLTDKVELYGGLDCLGQWKYVGAAQKTELAPETDEIPLRMTSTANGSAVNDFKITAVNATSPGGSSIAVLADGVTASLVRCDLVAGEGAAGVPGATPGGVGPNNEAANGVEGMAGGEGCTSAMGVFGADGGQNTCGRLDASGGLGGNGTTAASGGSGSDGQPQTEPPGPDGVGGKGQTASACMTGGTGREGDPGISGKGATGNGSLTPTGYSGLIGEDGKTAGAPGQGGGGGGGGKKCANANAGPSGGGGGSGGCGGQPGKGGRAGGSSIGLVSVEAKLTLSAVTITAGKGRNGGNGGTGQLGGEGGLGGHAVDPAACDGGKGGKGGPGGAGGGGLGGHSLGIAFTGTAPAGDTPTVTLGAPGAGGLGGDGQVDSNGAPGKACKSLDVSPDGVCIP